MKITNDSQIRSLQPDPEKEQTYSCGDGLFLSVFPTKTVRSGGKYFIAKYRYPPAGIPGKRKQKSYRIGSYGKGVGQFTLKEARQEWMSTKEWMHQTGGDPSDLKKQRRSQIQAVVNAPTLRDAAEEFLNWYQTRVDEGTRAPSTLKDLENKVNNSILPVLGDQILSGITRQMCTDLKNKITKRGKTSQSDKVFTVLGQVLQFAVEQGHIDANPAYGSKFVKDHHVVKHHDFIKEWEDVPDFFNLYFVQNITRSNVYILSLAQMMIFTGFRMGSLSQSKWSSIDINQKIMKIPPNLNLKSKEKSDFIIPLSDPVLEMLDNLYKMTGNSEFIFPSWNNEAKNLDASQVNTSMKKVDKYKDQVSGHGWRHFMTTHGQDVFNLDGDLLHFSTGHSKGSKVRQAYDHAMLISKRRDMYSIWAEGLCESGLDPCLPFKGI